MRKILFVASIAMLLIFNSCFSLPAKVIEKAFDPDLPPEQSAKVLFWLDLVEYNGLNIHKEWGSKNDNIPLITLPPGKAVFNFNGYFSQHSGNTTTIYTVNNCMFSYNFEAGKEYTVSWHREKKPGQYREEFFYVKVYGNIPKNKQYSATAFKEDDLLASILIFDTEKVKEEIKKSKSK